MQDNKDKYGAGGDVGRRQMRCGTTEMAKWVVRAETDWAILTRKDFQPEVVSSLQDNVDGRQDQR